jgi:subtilisin family serine protease
MLKLRLSLILIACGFGGLAAWAQSDLDTVQLGKHEAHATRILARYKSSGGVQARTDALNSANVTVRRQFPQFQGVVVLEASGMPSPAAVTPAARANALSARIQALRNSGQFEYVEPDYTVRASLQPTDSRFQDGTLWGLRNLGGGGGVIGADINAEQAWNITTGSTNVIVAVIDTGVRYTHQELAAQMWRNPGESGGGKESNGIDDDANGYIDDVFGINSITGSGDPFDDNDHGTHCSGTIGAQADGGGGHVGVAWKVQIMALKFLSAGGGGQTSDALECLNYAVAKGAKISNNSWGGGPFSQALFDALVAARSAGHLFIAAAGNEGSDNDVFLSYPSGYDLDNVISVAALDRGDRLANFSNYGLTKVDLGAPGVAIFSSTASTDSSYASFNGTSMAAPHVTGVAALILAQSPTANYLEIRERLLATTVPISSLQGRTVTGGRLNAFNALVAAPDGLLEIAVTPPSGSALLGGSTVPIFVRVTDLFAITGATVTGTLSTGGSVTFNNAATPPDQVAADAIYSGDLAVPNITSNVTFTVIVTAPGKESATNVLEYSIIPPPPNDNFAAASKLPNAGGSVVAVNQFASMEPGEPQHAGIPSAAASLWWNWSAAATGPVLVDTTGSSFDTLLAVYTGTNVVALTQLAAVDDVPNSLAGYLYFNATVANTYRIVVAGYDTNETGTIRLRLTPNGAPDTNAPTVAITSHLSGQNVATNRITVAGTAADAGVNSSGVSEVQLKVNGVLPVSTATGTTNWSATALLVVGPNTLEVWAYDFAGNQSVSSVITVNYFPPPPANDHFVQALSLTNASGSSAANTTLATKEFNEPNHASNVGGKSVWWRFVAPDNGRLSLTTTNSTFDTLLGVYTGTAVGSLTLVGGNDDAATGAHSELEVPVLSNQVYRIAVDGFAAASGDAVLTYAFSAMPVYTLAVSNSAGGSVAPGSALYVSNSLATLTATPNPYYVFSGWSGAVSSSVNPLTIPVQSNLSLTAQFALAPHTDGFESGGLSTLSWATAGGAPWIVQSTNVAAGSFAARSGSIANGQSSSLLLTGNFQAGLAAFDVRVSSEANWDTLSFFVDGVLRQTWSGEVPWGNYSTALTAGTHTLEWRYAKDASDSEGLDAAFIDNLDLPINVPIDSSSPGHLSLRRMLDGTYVVDLTGQTNQIYVVEFSPNLLNWTPLSTNVLIDGALSIPDPSSLTNAPRFYRAFVPVP